MNIKEMTDRELFEMVDMLLSEQLLRAKRDLKNARMQPAMTGFNLLLK